MKTKVGVWIDHRHAVIVTVTKNAEEITKVESEVESQLRRTGDSPLKGSYVAKTVPADYRRQNLLTSQLNSYYDLVIDRIHDPEAILIFGPGEANCENDLIDANSASLSLAWNQRTR